MILRLPILSAVVDPPSIVAAAVSVGELSISIARGGSSPDFMRFRVYVSSTPGVSPTSYDAMIESSDGNILDSGPWSEPLYIVATEVAYDGTESAPSQVLSVGAGGESRGVARKLLVMG